MHTLCGKGETACQRTLIFSRKLDGCMYFRVGLDFHMLMSFTRIWSFNARCLFGERAIGFQCVRVCFFCTEWVDDLLDDPELKEDRKHQLKAIHSAAGAMDAQQYASHYYVLFFSCSCL